MVVLPGRALRLPTFSHLLLSIRSPPPFTPHSFPARSRSETTSQFTVLALNKPSSSSSS